MTLYSLCCSAFALYLYVFGLYHFDSELFYLGCLSAVLDIFGFMMLGIAVVGGYAGPANALNSIQSLVLTVLSVSVLN